jgi:hypothetical protein
VLSHPTAGIVTVEILGQRYPIRSALDPTYVLELAGYVEAKMQAAASENQSADSLRIAVLAALNIADEFFRSRAGTPGGRRGAPGRSRDYDAPGGVAAVPATGRAASRGRRTRPHTCRVRTRPRYRPFSQCLPCLPPIFGLRSKP